MYCATKRMQEILALTFYHQYKVPVTILRLCGVVGPVGPQEAGGGRMWKSLSLQMKKGKEIHLPLFAPEEKGHFVDNRDVAAMHILVGKHPRATGEIFNCCGPKATTGKEFAALVEEIIPTAEVKFGYPWGVAQGVIEFDMSKMERLLSSGPILMGQVIVVVLLKKVYIMITREFSGLTSWESYVTTKNRKGCLSFMYGTMKSQESKPAVYRVLNILRIIAE